MYVAVVTFQAYPDQVEEVIKRYQEFGVPWMKSQKGMANFRVMTDKTSGKGRHVAVWETEADARAFVETGAFVDLFSRFRDVFTGPPAREVYELDIQA
ncbi:MAG: antibiotic biosynthesis monooxygenase [Betaproteobacteria bacterium]|nr:antibiotic biosynthesis monooxygenase [Betaproteobacteria bacterium]